jgi:DNA adenine methylase
LLKPNDTPFKDRGDESLATTQIPLPLGIQSDKTEREPVPFLKWAGGKSQLLRQMDQFFPDSFERYVEPFLGGGAVFFHIRTRFPKASCYLCDKNEELINCYVAVRDRPKELMERLDEHLRRFSENRVTYYYDVRGQHNISDLLGRAARMVFLNKTCFNGLWRVNASGEFNVPIGSAKKVSLYDRENLLAASSALKGTELVAQSFERTMALTQSGDFVYIDPPYDPASKTAYFTAYTKDEFGVEQQRQLANLFHASVLRGATLMLSNSNTPLIKSLYFRYKMHSVQARRMINSQAEGRGAVSELVVLGCQKGDYMELVNNSVRAWLLRNDYADIACLIDKVLSKWQRTGKKTRRNWWDVLAGTPSGKPITIEGYPFPVLRAARIRKGLAVTGDYLCRNQDEEIPPIIEQVRWKRAKRGAQTNPKTR